MIWTEEQKADMQRMREEGLSNADIGQRFNTGGDNVRKVLARRDKGFRQPAPAEAASEPAQSHRSLYPALPPERPLYPDQPGYEPRADSLRKLHDEFDAKVPARASSRPKWAGRPPLRITPKDFQT